MALPPSFHPLIKDWFAETFRRPTAVQEAAWPLIAAGRNVLALAPTGSGKTLTAFLAALSRFIDGTWDPGELAVLYVSPLKALNEDIRRNLVEPVEALRRRALAASSAAGDGPLFRIRVETRSGDTPPAERRRFLLHPPSILAVTPESLAILLLNPRGREVLSTVRCLVLDEIHALMGTKRGAFLSCQIDRLAALVREARLGRAENNTPDFQRIALSATVNPPELAAEFAGTDCIAAPPAEKEIHFQVVFPAGEPAGAAGKNAQGEAALRYGPRYGALVNHILERTAPGRKKSILVFTDSRRRAERIAFLLNKAAEEKIALCHHGSLSKEVRREVERRLQEGLVPCVVATSSLELGLDIGAVEEVILAGVPASAAGTLQRLGRSGHGVGESCRGTLLPFHGMELLAGAVLAGAVADREIERLRPVKNPLDILSQIVLALCAERAHKPGELYQRIRGFYVFRDLPRPSFDAVIAMLAGRYFSTGTEGDSAEGADTAKDGAAPDSAEGGGQGERLRELRPRLYQDTDGALYAARGTLGLLYAAGGVIPSRGLYALRLSDGTKIGELDEEFVFERRTGDCFDFGARAWKITAIGSEAVTVSPVEGAADFQPFWKADTPFRSAELCRRTLDFLAAWNSTGRLPGGESLSAEAAEALEELLSRQREALGDLPDHETIPVEIIDDPAGRPDAVELVFHTFRGGGVNYPLALALAAWVEDAAGLRAEAIPDDNAVLLHVPRIMAADPPAFIRNCVKALGTRRGAVLGGEALFRKRLETSGVFGAAFREAAERSMILPRGTFGRRLPLWVMRQRAKRLYDRTAARKDFPVAAEAWRTCLADRFDMAAFRTLLEDIARGKIAFRFISAGRPSPFAQNLSWREINSFMYEYDERKDLLGMAGGRGGEGAESLADRAVAEALADPSLRPVIGAETAASFGARLRREMPGYAPEETLALAQWVRDRAAVPADEWAALSAALPENAEAKQLLAADPSLGGRIREHRFPGASLSVTVYAGPSSGTENAADVLDQLGEWLRWEGPVRPERISAVFGVSLPEAEDALEALTESGCLVKDLFIEGEGGPCYCDAENAGLLLRLNRKKARKHIRERPPSFLVPFVALRQGLIPGVSAGSGGFTAESTEAPDTAAALDTLSCYPAPVKLWETEILPARNPAYRGGDLDGLLAPGRFLWFGAAREKAAFCAPGEFELALVPRREGSEFAGSEFPGNEGADGGGAEFLAALGAYCGDYRSFWEIRDELSRRFAPEGAEGFNRLLTDLIWDAVWRGRLSSDSWESVRRGIDRGFAGEGPAGPAGTWRAAQTRTVRVPRALRERWREGSPLPGRWYSLETDPPPGAYPEQEELSALEEEELNAGRVRLLLRRWGILCRPLLETEGLFSWSALLPAMRRMELAGELVTGRFFGGIPSLQFAAPSIAEELEAAEAAAGMPGGSGAGSGAAEKAPLYWMNAADPAAPPGWNIEGLDRRLPARTPHSRLYFRGGELAAVSGRGGKELTVFLPPEDPALPALFAFLALPRRRACHPVQKIVLETVNGREAAASPWAAALKEQGFIADRDKLVLW